MNRRGFIAALSVLPAVLLGLRRNPSPQIRTLPARNLDLLRDVNVGDTIEISGAADPESNGVFRVVDGAWPEWQEFEAVRVAAEAGDVRALDAFPGVARRLLDSAR